MGKGEVFFETVNVHCNKNKYISKCDKWDHFYTMKTTVIGVSHLLNNACICRFHLSDLKGRCLVKWDESTHF